MLSRGTILPLFFLLFCVTSAIAQTDRGSLTGRVTDPNGAGVANAKVTATNLNTAETREVQPSIHLGKAQTSLTLTPPRAVLLTAKPSSSKR